MKANVSAYYSTSIFREAGFTQSEALLTSMGTGITNFIFAIPAIYTIDTFGRRNLLLTTFPLMGLCLLWCGLSFYLPLDPETKRPSQERLASIAAAIYTCKSAHVSTPNEAQLCNNTANHDNTVMAVYSPGEGPVPFTYSAEAFPLHLRDVGMSFATATCWGFNFILSLTWPALRDAFTPTGAFCWYAAWNFFGFFYAYFLLPETKALTLEELDTVFDVGNRQFSAYYRKKLPWYMRKHILRQNVEPMEPLFDLHEKSAGSDYTREPVGSSDKAGVMGGTDTVEKREVEM